MKIKAFICSTTSAVALATALIGQALASGHHEAQALEHAAMASAHTEHGHGNLSPVHLKSALNHAIAAETAHAAKHKHLSEAVKHLEEAIKHRDMEHADISESHISEAVSHIHEAFN